MIKCSASWVAHVNLSDNQVKSEISAVVAQERALQARFLELLAEVDRREIYAALGFGSLFRYCTEYLGLTEQQAYLRIAAARAGRRHPRVFQMIADGQTNMSALRVVASDLDKTADAGPILDEIAGKTKREVVEMVGDAAGGHAERAMLVPVDSKHHQLFATVPNEIVDLLGRVADLGGPTDPMEAIAEGLKLLVTKQWKTKMKGTYTKGRKISGQTKRTVDTRDQQRCAFVGEDGRRCEETRNLQFDHVTPVALGPTKADDPDAFRLCCPVHNRFEAKRVLGNLYRPPSTKKDDARSGGGS